MKLAPLFLSALLLITLESSASAQADQIMSRVKLILMAGQIRMRLRN